MPLPPGRVAAKVVYSDSGVLKISPEMLPAGFDPRRVRVQREGVSLPALALNADGLFLYAPGYSDAYTDKDVFFLTPSATPTAAGQPAAAQGLFNAPSGAMSSSTANFTQQFHDVYYDFNLRPYDYPPWFSSQYLTEGSLQSFALNIPNAASGAATLTLNLWSLSDADSDSADHQIQAVLNGVPVGQALWMGGGKMLALQFDLPPGALKSGSNQLDLVTPVIPGVSGGLSLLQSISVNYVKALAGPGPVQLNVSSQTPAQIYEVDEMPSANVWVVDARYPTRPALVAYESKPQPDGTFAIRFRAAPGGTGQYLAVPAGSEISPLSVSKRTPAPIKSVAYLATGPAQFAAVLNPLLLMRNKEGLRSLFVDQEAIFDYYGYGRYGPQPIQNAVRAVRPKYLLLAGRTTYDYHNYSGNGVDPLCPTFLVSTTSWAQSESDALFGDLGRGYSEVAVGRLPFDTPAEMSGAVSRTLGYAGLPPSGWRGHMATDQTDPPNFDFPSEGKDLVAAVPAMTWTENLLGITCQTSPEATEALRQAACGNADVIVFVGHGNSARLGRLPPRILDTSLVQAWTASSIFLQSSCNGNFFANDATGWRSIAMQALCQPQGGIAASISSSTFMESTPHVAFMKQLLAEVQEPGMRWGAAVMKTQQWAAQQSGLGGTFAGSYTDLSKSESILGDPALPVFKKP